MSPKKNETFFLEIFNIDFRLRTYFMIYYSMKLILIFLGKIPRFLLIFYGKACM